MDYAVDKAEEILKVNRPTIHSQWFAYREFVACAYSRIQACEIVVEYILEFTISVDIRSTAEERFANFQVQFTIQMVNIAGPFFGAVSLIVFFEEHSLTQ